MSDVGDDHLEQREMSDVGDDHLVQMSATRSPAKPWLVESFMGRGMAGVRIDKEELRRKIQIPHYIRKALTESVRSKYIGGGFDFCVEEVVDPPEAPIVVFVNSKSGGRQGTALKGWLQNFVGEEQVIRLGEIQSNLGF